jgi:4-amino-4-deoxy-L-arabinose transferase-like glycosyltransferase
LPAALIALVAVLAASWTAPRTDRARAGAVLWGGWLLVTGLTFSYMSGTIHPYYTVALAPAIAAMVGVGGRVLWLYRDRLTARAVLAAMVLSTGGWGWVLLGRAEWWPALRWASLVLGAVFALVMLVPMRRLRGLAVVALVAAVLTTGAAGAAYAAATVSVAHTGSIPTSGPSGASGMGGGGGTGRGFPGGGGGSMGGGQSSDTELDALLEASTTRWSAAVSGATSAADLELASGTAVIALGGWNGSDPSPTLAEFQAYVAAGDISYFISGGGMGGGGQGGATTTESARIAEWVAANYTATTVGSATVYDLTS